MNSYYINIDFNYLQMQTQITIAVKYGCLCSINNYIQMFKINPKLKKNQYTIVDFTSLQITNATFQKISQNRKIRKIKFINLSFNQLTHQAMFLFQNQGWKSLMYINLWGNKLGTNGCKILSQAQLSNLQELDLRSNEIKNMGVKHLVKAKWPVMKFLTLHNNYLGLDCIYWLIRANWMLLQEIGLNDNLVNWNEINHISVSQFKSLKKVLLIWNNRLTDNEKKNLPLIKANVQYF